MSLETEWQRFERADAWLKSLIRPDGGEWALIGQQSEEKLRRHRARQDSTRAFLEFLGNPQERLRAVVVVGTAGKGTVTSMIAGLLRATGANVADHTSPYLQLPTEKMRFNGVPISGAEFADCVDELRDHYDRWCGAGNDLRYGQAWTALVVLWMARSGADWCVYEASVGGRLSNAALLRPEVAVVTNVGLDHIETLGPGLDEISWHKAGIAAHAGHVVTTETGAEALALIQSECAASGATFERARWRRREASQRAEVDVGGSWLALDGTPADYQAANAAAALTVVRHLTKCSGFELPTAAASALCHDSVLPGRFEIVSHAPRVILDGAHNVDKMKAFVSRFRQEFPGKRATVVFGALSAKSPAELVQTLTPIAADFIALEPRVVGKAPLSAEEVRRLVAEAADVPCVVGTGAVACVEAWLAGADPSGTLIITGSMYLVGEVRSYWFPIRKGLGTTVCDT